MSSIIGRHHSPPHKPVGALFQDKFYYPLYEAIKIVAV